VATQVVGKASRETTSYVSLDSCTKEGHGKRCGPLSIGLLALCTLFCTLNEKLPQ
jgi:hypothetical protein